MSLTTGTRLGHYQIESQLGSGGMGEVYRARDSRLNRSVAIKILLEHISDQPDARARFEREAQTIARLNHPHICVLHDVGRHENADFLVMELLEGETLEKRLERGPLTTAQALHYAIEITDALDKAHRLGITHRDLKPGNVMLTKAGVKLLDFGLAKLRQPATLSSASAVMTKVDATVQGTILGTLQYMAPEQLEGRDADARTDIFAFGTVLYEMVTGKKAFAAKSQVGLIGAILEREPIPVSTFQPAIPPNLEALIGKCLAKDPEDRWQSAGDLTVSLKWIVELKAAAGTARGAHATRSKTTSPLRKWISVFAAAAVMAIALAGFWFSTLRSRMPEVSFAIHPPENGVFESAFSSAYQQLIPGNVSPDGKKVIFPSKDPTGKIMLWVRSLGAIDPTPLQGTEGSGGGGFWSPDSQFLAFFSRGWLKTVKITGGPVQALSVAPTGRGGTWNGDGTIVFAPNTAGVLFRVSSAGGDPAPATQLEPGQLFHTYPNFLPDGVHFTYYAGGTSSSSSGVYLGSLDSLAGQRLFDADSTAVYAWPGYLLYNRKGILFARAFDGKQPLDAPIPLAESVPVSPAGFNAFSVSDNGVLTYRTGPVNSSDLQLAWFDRATGKLTKSLGMAGGYRGVELSPLDNRIAVHRHDGSGGGDVWVFEPTGSMSQFTFDPSQDNSMPLWSPTTPNKIVFSSLRNGKWGLYLSDGTDKEELLFESEVLTVPMSWAPDGESIVFLVSDPKTLGDLWVLPLTGGRTPKAIIHSPFNETLAQISPDGRWIAYVSGRSGREAVYVQSFPSGEGRRQVSQEGGSMPRWRQDGRELFYRDSRGWIVSVPVNGSGSTFEVGPPEELLSTGVVNVSHSGGDYHSYAVSRDGRQFLTGSPPGQTSLSPISVVLDWPRLLRN